MIADLGEMVQQIAKDRDELRVANLALAEEATRLSEQLHDYRQGDFGRLTEENRQLREALVSTDGAGSLGINFRLSRQESHAIAALMKRPDRLLPLAVLQAALQTADHEVPSRNHINVLLCRARAKLPKGIQIKNQHGAGWLITKESAERLNVAHLGRSQHVDPVVAQIPFVVKSSRVAKITGSVQLGSNLESRSVAKSDR